MAAFNLPQAYRQLGLCYSCLHREGIDLSDVYMWVPEKTPEGLLIGICDRHNASSSYSKCAFMNLDLQTNKVWCFNPEHEGHEF